MTEGLQPFLSDAVAVLRAPTQVWSRADGEIGAGAIDGVFHGDTRFVRATRVRYGTDAATHARSGSPARRGRHPMCGSKHCSAGSTTALRIRRSGSRGVVSSSTGG